MADIKVENVSFSYDSEKLILKDINMEVNFGSFVCILGQSGCGKSTLLRLLAGLERPNSGKVIVGEEELKKPNLDMGVVFQNQGLFPWMTAGENILLALNQKFPEKTKEEKLGMAYDYLQEVGLDKECFHKLPNELSGGMQQRCAIARAFSIDPPILLMDEPFGALDAVTRSNLQDLVLNLWEKEKDNKKTIFFVTHDVEEALFLATDIFILGQSPSSIVYKYSFKDKKNITRERLHKDQGYINLRNEFIRILNEEITKNKNIIKEEC